MSAAPRAHIAHALKKRVRLYVPSKRGSDAYFSKVRDDLEGHELIDEVRVNADTGSILIFHSGDEKAVLEEAQRKGLITLASQTKAEPKVEQDWPEMIFDALSRLDRRIRTATDDAFDLQSSTALVLIGLSALQAKRREVLPPATALMAQALNLLTERKKARQEMRKLRNMQFH